MITLEQNKIAKAWLKDNRKTVANYAGEWIAYNDTGIIAHHKEQAELMKVVRASGQDFILRYLHPTSFMRVPRLLPVRFRSLKSHQWEPVYLVVLRTAEYSLA